MSNTISPTSNANTQSQLQPSSATSAEGDAALSSDFETFLKMLTVQMQNQDPLNPIDSTDYAVQLATFSGVEQQVQTNDLLKSLSSKLSGSDFTQFASWVGMKAGTNEPIYFDNHPIEILPTAAEGADTMTLKVKDENDTVIYSEQLTNGSDLLSWDGRDSSGATASSGFYSFEIESYKDGALLSSSAASAYTPIIEARANTSGTTLILFGGKEVQASEVSALREPQ